MLKQHKSTYSYFLDYLCQSDDPKKSSKILDAVLTEKEQHELINRLLIFSMLQQGKPQREISEKLQVGIATVSRGAKAYQQHKVDKLLPDIGNDLADITK